MASYTQLSTLIAVAAIALPARAHVCMEAPLPRVGAACTFASPQKVGPCGVAGRTSNAISSMGSKFRCVVPSR
jgi:hypothetical protein